MVQSALTICAYGSCGECRCRGKTSTRTGGPILCHEGKWQGHRKYKLNFTALKTGGIWHTSKHLQLFSPSTSPHTDSTLAMCQHMPLYDFSCASPRWLPGSAQPSHHVAAVLLCPRQAVISSVTGHTRLSALKKLDLGVKCNKQNQNKWLLRIPGGCEHITFATLAFSDVR